MEHAILAVYPAKDLKVNRKCDLQPSNSGFSPVEISLGNSGLKKEIFLYLYRDRYFIVSHEEI